MEKKGQGPVQPLNKLESNDLYLEIDELEARLEKQVPLLHPGTEDDVCPYFFCGHKCEEKCMTILTE